jgi:hypothetical protein
MIALPTVIKSLNIRVKIIFAFGNEIIPTMLLMVGRIAKLIRIIC